MPRKQSKIVYLDDNKQRRHSEVLEDLFHQHETALKKFLRARVGVDGPVEDLAQEVYFRLARIDDLIGKVNRNNGCTRSYMFSIANNLVIDRARRRNRRQELGLSHPDKLPEPLDSRTPEDIVEQRTQLTRIRRSLKQMRPNWSKALLMHRFSNMNYRQIALKMDVSPKRVEKYIANALRVLREDRKKYEVNDA